MIYLKNLKIVSRNNHLLEIFTVHVTLYEKNKINSFENSNAYHKHKKFNQEQAYLIFYIGV